MAASKHDKVQSELCMSTVKWSSKPLLKTKDKGARFVTTIFWISQEDNFLALAAISRGKCRVERGQVGGDGGGRSINAECAVPWARRVWSKSGRMIGLISGHQGQRWLFWCLHPLGLWTRLQHLPTTLSETLAYDSATLACNTCLQHLPTILWWCSILLSIASTWHFRSLKTNWFGCNIGVVDREVKVGDIQCWPLCRISRFMKRQNDNLAQMRLELWKKRQKCLEAVLPANSYKRFLSCDLWPR